MLLDDVKIVEKPFSGGCYLAARFGGQRQSAKVCDQAFGVVIEPAAKRSFRERTAANRLRLGQALGVLLETFCAEEFSADRLITGTEKLNMQNRSGKSSGPKMLK